MKKCGLMHPDAVKPRLFYDLRQMLEGSAEYYFKQIMKLNCLMLLYV